MKTLLSISFFFIALSFASCTSSKSGPHPLAMAQSHPIVSKDYSSNQNKALPRAVIYRTNGDYIDNVPVNLNASHTILVSFPAPTDISSRSCPVEIGDGWLFDRRGGIGINTVFLSYTFAEYSALPSTPSTSKIMESIIPGSGVTQCVVTPVLYSEALATPDILKQYIPR